MLKRIIVHVDINLGRGAIRLYEFKLKDNETPSLDFDYDVMYGNVARGCGQKTYT